MRSATLSRGVSDRPRRLSDRAFLGLLLILFVCGTAVIMIVARLRGGPATPDTPRNAAVELRETLARYNNAMAAWSSSSDPVAAKCPYCGNSLFENTRSGKEFYVSADGNDNADGSASSPFATITKAAKVATPGTTVHVMPGTYVGEIVTTTSGTPSARIVFISDRKWQAKLRSTAEKSGIHWENRGDYVDIIGFDMSGEGAYGIYNRASNVRILRNHIHDYTHVECNSEGGAGIAHGINAGKYSGHDNDTIGNVVHNIKAPCDKPHGSGIYYSTAGGHIYNNVVYNNGKNGIQMYHAATNVVVANNTSFDNFWSGIIVSNEGMCCGSSTGVNDHTIVTNNISYHNGKFGIEEFDQTGLNNIYADNVVYGNTQGDVHLQHGLQALRTINAAPDFVNYQPKGDGDYRLKTSSPAKSKGGKLGAPSYDIDGAARFHGGPTCNVGAYE